MLIGRQLNFQKARELALSNDLAGMMKEVVRQVGSEQQLLKMNAIQRQAIADAIGVSSGELSKMIDNEGKALTAGQKLADVLGIDEIVAEEAIANLTSLINSMESIAKVVAESLLPVLEPLFMLIDMTLGNILRMANAIKVVLLPALTAWAAYAAVAAFNTAAGMSALTLGLGVAAIVLGMATFKAWFDGNQPQRFNTLPKGMGANIQSGTAIADAGESIVHTSDLESTGGTETLKALRAIKSEVSEVKNALRNLDLNTSVKGKDLNVALTPKNG